ncbi:MAG: SAM-dependent methyltransferase [Gammaproteobacteria bacterium]|jgi:predicted O-methyltransferase YrrM|nr:SAM-dependent methyltransferase [Gammaproteobacteria bacterium]
MTGKTLPMSEALETYLREVSLREPGILRRLREETAGLPEAQMQIAPEQGQFLNLLVGLLGAKRIIEVGTFTGYSALWMAQALPEDGRLVACDVSEEWTDIARRYWAEAGVAERIDLRLAPALETLEALLEEERGHYDLAFIDADKANYEAYYEACLKLLDSTGLVVIDNTLWSGRVIDPEADDEDTVAIRQFNDKLHADERVDLSLLPLADGLTLARKR